MLLFNIEDLDKFKNTIWSWGNIPREIGDMYELKPEFRRKQLEAKIKEKKREADNYRHHAGVYLENAKRIEEEVVEMGKELGEIE